VSRPIARADYIVFVPQLRYNNNHMRIQEPALKISSSRVAKDFFLSARRAEEGVVSTTPTKVQRRGRRKSPQPHGDMANLLLRHVASDSEGIKHTFVLAPRAAKDWPISRPKRFSRWVLISGSLAYDRIMDYPGRFSDSVVKGKTHTLNISFVAQKLSESFGGTAGNIAYGLALLGEKPTVLASAGQDFARYRERLLRAGADVSRVRIIPKKPTASATIMTDRADNQITAFHLGAMAEPYRITAKDIPSKAFAIVAAGNLHDMRRLPALYRKKHVDFIFDPGQQIPALSARDIRNGITGAKVFISNDYELAMVAKKTGWTDKEILSRVETLVTTLGAKGSLIRTNTRAGIKTFHILPVRAKKVVDPTGAGDAYRAGFIKGLFAGWPVEVAGCFGGVLSAFAIETYGPQEYRVTFRKACSRYVKSFGTKLPQ
jgi:adenosine kinase